MSNMRIPSVSDCFSYWGDIDTALRTAAVDKGVEVRLLISWWQYSRANEKLFLKSLADLTSTYPDVNITVVSIYCLMM